MNKKKRISIVLSFRLLHESIEKYGEVAQFYGRRAKAYLELKKYNEALEDAQRAIEIDPNSPEGYYIGGMILLHLDQHEKGEELLKKGKGLDPSDSRFDKPLKKLANESIQRKYTEALAEAKRSFLKKKYQEAIEVVTKLVRKNPTNHSYYHLRSIHLLFSFSSLQKSSMLYGKGRLRKRDYRRLKYREI